MPRSSSRPRTPKGIVYVDAGHGGSDPGSGATLKKPEKTVALEVSKRLERELWSRGFRVFMSRRVDSTLGLGTRAKRANNLGADLFVSVHCNAHTDPQAHGFEAWTFYGETAADRFARATLDAFASAFPDMTNRGAKEANYTVLRETRCPAILFELAFITNAAERRALYAPAWQQRAAQAIATGIALAFEGGSR